MSSAIAACIATLLIVLCVIMAFVTFAQYRNTRDNAYICFTSIFMIVAVTLMIALMHFNPHY